MKFKSIVILVLLGMITNGCGVFKESKVDRSISEETVKNDTKVVKEEEKSSVKEQLNKSESSTKVLTEEIVYKKPIIDTRPIELTATFKIDSSALLKGDTVLKLLDINNDDVSVTIIQNKLTNELTAKVKTPRSTRTVPFEELTIKKNYTESDLKTDSTITETLVTSVKLDSVNKNKTERYNKEVKKESKPSFWGSLYFWIGVGVLIVIVYLFLTWKGILPNIFKKKSNV